MANIQTRIYRNDSNNSVIVPGLGEILPGQRVTFQGEFPPAINLQNFPGLVDVLDEEENGIVHNYEKDGEPAYEPAKPGGGLTSSSLSQGDNNNG